LCALTAQTAFDFPDTQSSAQLVEIVISVRDEEREIVQKIYDQTETDIPLQFARGGATRAESVRAAIEVAGGDFVLVHDAARPCLLISVTRRVVQAALQHGAAIAALPADDTVKRVSFEGEEVAIRETLDRNHIYLAQTPQMFRRELLRHAFDFAAQTGWQGTDCASYVEHLAHQSRNRVLEPVKIVRGDAHNLKVTYGDDIARAETWLQRTESA
jgi:2-C-methyl-D-erythritol 4-phosphate cytidylyltransferase